MVIKISDIPPEGLELDLFQVLDLFDQGTASTTVTAHVGIKPIGGGNLLVKGRVQAAPVLDCSRCLKTFPYAVDTELTINLAPAHALGTVHEHELARSELDQEFYQGEEIDPVEYVKEQVLISLPMVPLHHPDCKGLCPICGTDLNETECHCQKDTRGDFGAFSALKDLFKK